MKQKKLILLAIVALAFAGCGSDRSKNNDKDSLISDSAVIDTAELKAAPADTTAMRIDPIDPD